LFARDYDTALDFYQRVFHLESRVMGDSGEFRYSTLASDGVDVGGVFDAHHRLAADVAPYWLVYWQVDDIEVAAARVQELGGHLLEAPSVSPYGTICTVSDPSGAQFRLRSSVTG
jgi:predicted enzyme related to lactoylglutathione lyase